MSIISLYDLNEQCTTIDNSIKKQYINNNQDRIYNLEKEKEYIRQIATHVQEIEYLGSSLPLSIACKLISSHINSISKILQSYTDLIKEIDFTSEIKRSLCSNFIHENSIVFSKEDMRRTLDNKEVKIYLENALTHVYNLIYMLNIYSIATPLKSTTDLYTVLNTIYVIVRNTPYHLSRTFWSDDLVERLGWITMIERMRQRAIRSDLKLITSYMNNVENIISTQVPSELQRSLKIILSDMELVSYKIYSELIDESSSLSLDKTTKLARLFEYSRKMRTMIQRLNYQYFISCCKDDAANIRYDNLFDGSKIDRLWDNYTEWYDGIHRLTYYEK